MAHDDDDGDSARRSASSGSFDENQELAATSVPQCAPAKSSGPLSDDSSSTKKKTHRGPVMQAFHLLSEWVSWFLRVWAKYSPLLAAVAAPMSTLLDIPALAVSGE